MTDPRAAGLVKMSELSRQCGVPAPTIKHYIREGLLPEPALRTSRNMAWYDPGMVPRIQAIKELQRTRFLPLKVIKGILDGAVADETRGTLVDAISRVLSESSAHAPQTRRALLDAGYPDGDLRLLEAIGAIVPTGEGDDAVFSGEDIELLETVRGARAAGLTDAMLPPAILGPYLDAVRQLVRLELKLFREGVIPNAGEDLPRLAEAATRASERLVVLLRRKLLIPTLEQIIAEERIEPDDHEDSP